MYSCSVQINIYMDKVVVVVVIVVVVVEGPVSKKIAVV